MNPRIRRRGGERALPTIVACSSSVNIDAYVSTNRASKFHLGRRMISESLPLISDHSRSSSLGIEYLGTVVTKSCNSPLNSSRLTPSGEYPWIVKSELNPESSKREISISDPGTKVSISWLCDRIAMPPRSASTQTDASNSTPIYPSTGRKFVRHILQF